jgi:hypothetical protein
MDDVSSLAASSTAPDDGEPSIPRAARGADRSHELGLLRLELMQFERQAHDLMRYKLFASAVLGGVAVGVGPAVSDAVTWVIVLIPLVCIFVDAAHVQIDSAILTIAQFLRKHPDHVLGQYEQFVADIRGNGRSPILLHYIVLSATTVLLSIAVATAGIWMLLVDGYSRGQGIATVSSGSAGIVLGSLMHLARRREMRASDRR